MAAVTRLGPGGYPAAALASGAITGSLAATEADDTLSAAGSEVVTGSLAATEAGDTLSAAAGAIVGGSLSATEAADTLSAAGGEAITGALAVTEANDTLAATGTNTTPLTLRDVDVTLTKKQLERLRKERREREKRRHEDFAREGRRGSDIRKTLTTFFEDAEPEEIEAISAELPMLPEGPKAAASRPNAKFIERIDWRALETSKDTLARISAAVEEYGRYHEKLRLEAEDEADVEFILMSM